METQAPLILYTREQCHLCELAVLALERLGLQWEAVDIDSDEKLEERYGLTIPVVRDRNSGREISFPFGEADLLKLGNQ